VYSTFACIVASFCRFVGSPRLDTVPSLKRDVIMAKRHMSLDLGATSTIAVVHGGLNDDLRPVAPLDRSEYSSTDGAAAKRVQSDTWSNVATVPGGMSLSSRRERRSPTIGCKRPMAIGLPRLNLSLIKGWF